MYVDFQICIINGSIKVQNNGLKIPMTVVLSHGVKSNYMFNFYKSILKGNYYQLLGNIIISTE